MKEKRMIKAEERAFLSKHYNAAPQVKGLQKENQQLKKVLAAKERGLAKKIFKKYCQLYKTAVLVRVRKKMFSIGYLVKCSSDTPIF